MQREWVLEHKSLAVLLKSLDSAHARTISPHLAFICASAISSIPIGPMVSYGLSLKDWTQPFKSGHLSSRKPWVGRDADQFTQVFRWTAALRRLATYSRSSEAPNARFYGPKSGLRITEACHSIVISFVELVAVLAFNRLSGLHTGLVAIAGLAAHLTGFGYAVYPIL
jgi:hypothetical protein